MKKLLYIVIVFVLFAVADAQAQKPSTREVTTETSVSKGSLIRIVGANRRLNIKSCQVRWMLLRLRAMEKRKHFNPLPSSVRPIWLMQML
jgi:hypothetical protein